jgi:WD40 repeat protein
LVVCLDVAGRLFAATKVQAVDTGAPSRIYCLAIDQRGYIYGGCEDRCLRVWGMDKGHLREVCIQKNMHDGGVTAIAMNSEGSVVITGGEDGSVMAWRVELE